MEEHELIIKFYAPIDSDAQNEAYDAVVKALKDHGEAGWLLEAMGESDD